MMARQSVRLPILTIEGEAPFFWVSLGLRESDAYRALVVQDFEGVAVEDGDAGAGEVGGESRDHPGRKDCPTKGTLPTIVETLTTASSHGYFIFLGS